MKIEMAESMVYSWLRKVKQCRIVQTNWKPSPEWPLENVEELERLKTAAEAYFADVITKVEDGSNTDADSTEFDADDTITDTSDVPSLIFKKTANLEQLIAQTECDVLGLCLDGGKHKAIAVEVAFHENGLNYSGGRKVTAKKIVSKFLRIIIALRAYCGVDEAELIFASPHVKKATLQQVNEMMDELVAFLQKENLGGFSVSVMFNEDFQSELIVPLVQSVEQHGAADGSELFVRALKLISLGDKLPRTSSPAPKQDTDKKPSPRKNLPNIVTVNFGSVGLSASISPRLSFMNWLVEKLGISVNTAKSYASGVNTSSKFARENLDDCRNLDFFAMTDAVEVEKKVQQLLSMTSYMAYSEKSNHSRKCGLERYVEYMKDKQS